MAERRVRPEQQIELGETGDLDAQVRRAAGRPLVGEGASPKASDADPIETPPHVESGREHQGVELVVLAVFGDDPPRLDPVDRCGHQRDVRAGEGRPVVVGQQDPFAPQRIVRGQCFAGRRIGDRLCQACQGLLLHQTTGAVQSPEAQHPRLQTHIGAPPCQPPEQRHPGVALLAGAGPRAVIPRQDPRGRPLENLQRADPIGQARHELDGRGAGADHADPNSGEVVVLGPIGGVQHPTGERSEPWQIRPTRDVQPADTEHEGPRGPFPAVGRQHLPTAPLPGRLSHLGAEDDP